jgi:hypothetical protein
MLRLPLLISLHRNPRLFVNKARPFVASFLSAAAFAFAAPSPVQKSGMHSSVVIIGSGSFPSSFPHLDFPQFSRSLSRIADN